MRYAHSILLGELLEAPAISYDDCKSFQIVCPACHEPLFKVVRDMPPSTHYFSHYSADAAYAKDCELRVANMSSAEVEKRNTAARGQSLRLFLRVLQQCIINSQYDDQNRAPAEQAARQFRESKPIRWYRDAMFEHAHETFRALDITDADDILQDYVNDITLANFPRTAFSLATQKRIAWDVWQHVLSPAARGNYTFLLSHAAVYLVIRLELAKASRSLLPFEALILNTLLAVQQSEPPVIDAFCRILAETEVLPPHSQFSSDGITKMSAELTHECLGILLRLPYFELLKEAQAPGTSAERAN